MPESNALPDAVYFRLEHDPHWHLNDPTFRGEVRAACGHIDPIERLQAESIFAIYPPLHGEAIVDDGLPICDACQHADA